MVITYKCPGCGAAVEYDGQSGMLVCAHCGRKMRVEDLQAEDESDAEQDAAWQEEDEQPLGSDAYYSSGYRGGPKVKMKLYHCPSCGAELMTDENTAATICSFCGNPGLIADRMSGVESPSEVLPFEITKEEAKEQFRSWTRHSSLAPSSFGSDTTLDKVTGVYVPYWLYNLDVNVALRAIATRTRTIRRGDMQYIYTDHYSVFRSVESAYDRIPVDASDRMDDDVMDSLEPYDYSGMKPFDMAYLSGYMAEKYNSTSDELQGRAKARAQDAAVDVAKSTINGYLTVNVVDQRIAIQEEKADYVMLPVWVMNYHYKDRNYTLTMNGQTGKKNGTLPISPARVIRSMGIYAAICFAALSLFSIVTGVII